MGRDYRQRILHIDWNDAGRIAPWEGEMMRDDEQIIACYHSLAGDCQTCPDNARCLVLFEQELARHLGTEPPEEVEGC